MEIGSEFRTPMDALVVGSVRKLLGSTSIGIDDNFLDVGGNSIMAIRLGQILTEELGISRTARIVFRNPVLKDLSDVLSELADDAH